MRTLVLVCLLATTAVAQPPARIAWVFDQPGQLRGWTASGHVADLAIQEGALAGRAAGTDPILMGPVFEVQALATQRIEIEMQASDGGHAQLFWTHTLEGPHGGFSEERCFHFDVQGDGQWRTYRLYPFWHPVGKVVRLRFDPPGQGTFAVRSIRIVEEPAAPSSTARTWNFAEGPSGWRAWQDVGPSPAGSGTMALRSRGPLPLLASPLLAVPAGENRFVAIRMSADRGREGRIHVVTKEQTGWESLAFDLRADGRMHTYNIDMSESSRWKGEILMLALQPTDTEGVTVRLESVEIANEPRGPAELEITYFGKTEGVNRAGRPAGVTCQIRNLGGTPSTAATATLHVGPGAAILDGAEKTVSPITLDQPVQVHWSIQGEKPGEPVLSVSLKTDGPGNLTAQAVLPLTPAPATTPGQYIPEPQPARDQLQVGAFYFPGFPNIEKWKPILDYPLRKPVLGWYDEGNPECADWQIKWAVEHGVDFFMVDWYWHKGGRHLEHWLHDAYMKSRFRKDLKWCVMWANHNAKGSHSLEDWRAVTQFWIDHYLKMDEYYRIDGRPAVFIWAPDNIRNDVGGTAEAAKLYALSQEMAKEAGLPGIYFVAMHGHDTAAKAALLRAEGYEAMTSYHGFELAAQRAGKEQTTFADVVATAEEVWRQADARSSGLDYFPIADTGWSSEPWHGRKARRITGRTPELFGALCAKLRNYAEANKKPIVVLGPWNEWGEGSYIEPHNEAGFGHLDALRSALAPENPDSPHLIPADLGMGPYDVEGSPER